VDNDVPGTLKAPSRILPMFLFLLEEMTLKLTLFFSGLLLEAFWWWEKTLHKIVIAVLDLGQENPCFSNKLRSCVIVNLSKGPAQILEGSSNNLRTGAFQ